MPRPRTRPSDPDPKAVEESALILSDAASTPAAPSMALGSYESYPEEQTAEAEVNGAVAAGEPSTGGRR